MEARDLQDHIVHRDLRHFSRSRIFSAPWVPGRRPAATVITRPTVAVPPDVKPHGWETGPGPMRVCTLSLNGAYLLRAPSAGWPKHRQERQCQGGWDVHQQRWFTAMPAALLRKAVPPLKEPPRRKPLVSPCCTGSAENTRKGESRTVVFVCRRIILTPATRGWMLSHTCT